MNAGVPPPKPSIDDLGGTCDWGYCDDETVDARWSWSTRQWLPVCANHRFGPPVRQRPQG